MEKKRSFCLFKVGSYGMPDAATTDKQSIKVLLALVAIVPAVATAITGFLAYQVNEKVASVNAQLSALESHRAFDLEIYRAVKDSLGGNERDQRVAIALVRGIGREPLRSALLVTLEDSEAPNIVAEARSNRMIQKPTYSKSTKPESIDWADWDFDLFHCESSSSVAKAQAEKLASAMLDDGAKGRIRVRLLSKSKNQEIGYRKEGYSIYRSADESAMAGKLANFAKNEEKLEFRIKASSQRTPWYVSAFLCP
jgi:hypothetical protein